MREMIVFRLVKGIREHFKVRLSEWLMAYPLVGMWLVFQHQPDLFEKHYAYHVLNSWAPESVWALLCIMCACCRVAALTLNGTFQGFRYTPHMRALASLAGVLFWSQYSLGFVMTALGGAVTWIPVVTYTTFCLAELSNVYRAIHDASVPKRYRK